MYEICNVSQGLIKEGLERGRKEGEIKALDICLKMSVEEIAEDMNLDIEYVKKVVDSL